MGKKEELPYRSRLIQEIVVALDLVTHEYRALTLLARIIDGHWMQLATIEFVGASRHHYNIKLSKRCNGDDICIAKASSNKELEGVSRQARSSNGARGTRVRPYSLEWH